MGRAFIGNFKGPKGDKGARGPQGIQGIQGPAGPTGTVDAGTPVNFEESTTLANIESGESLSVIFGKIKKTMGSMLIGAGSTLLGQNLTAARALVSDVKGKVGVSTITAAELGYLAGLKKNAQSQIDELNGNLAGILNGTLNIPKINISTQDELVTVLNNMQKNAANDSVYFATVRCVDIPTGGILPSQVYMMCGYKYSMWKTYGYGVQIFVSYGINDVYICKYAEENVFWKKISMSNV